MGRTEINVGAVLGATGQINSAKSYVGSAKSAFTQTKNNVDGKIKNRSNIRSRLDTVQRQLSDIDSRIGKIHSTVQFGATQYRNVDDRINRDGRQIKSIRGVGSPGASNRFACYFDDDFIRRIKNTTDTLRRELNISDIFPDAVIERVFKFSEDKVTFLSALTVLQMGDQALSLFGVESENTLDIFGTDTFKEYVLKLKREQGDISLFNKEQSATIGLESSGDFDKIDDKFKDLKERTEKYLEKNDLFEKKEETTYYKDDKEIDKKDAPDFYERKATIAEIKAETEAKVSLYEEEYSFLGGTGTVTVGEAEAHAGIHAGMYLMGADGKQVFSPGVSAEIGVSVTAFQADYENQLLGNEMLGLNVDAEVTALSASAEASAEVNFFGKDKKGNVVFDPQANVGVEAEAVLVEAEGSIGVNVLGGEASLKGSVKVGVGAHANLGLKDGVIKCEIGASLGIGFDVGFEVDVGGMVNTVADAAKSALEEIRSWWR